MQFKWISKTYKFGEVRGNCCAKFGQNSEKWGWNK